MSGGTLDVRQLTMQESTRLEGIGSGVTIEVSDLLINNGEIAASGGSTMVFVSNAASPWDLDGTGHGSGNESGRVTATSGNIVFAAGSLADTFDGTMTIGDA